MVTRTHLSIALVVALAVLAVVGRMAWDSRGPSYTLGGSVVTVPETPEELQEDLTTSREADLSWRDRFWGTTVIPPEQGDGPTIKIEEPFDPDTALSLVKREGTRLHTTRQVIDSAGQAHLEQLPVKDVSKCPNNFTVGANGLVRCHPPRLGVLDLVASGAVGVGPGSGSLDDRLGLEWRRYEGSTVRLQVYTKPSELLQPGGTKVYVGISLRKNLFGN